MSASDSSRLRVAIVGAGIGGLTAALCLSARGFPVTLVERRTRLTEIGAGLQLSPNASRVLDDLGLGPGLRRVATEPERVVIRRIGGAEVGTVALGPFMRERFGAPYLVVLRSDLQTVLLDAARARPGIRLMVGRTVVGVEPRPEGAVLALEGATGSHETLEAEVVVGADGLRSTIRRAVGGGASPAYGGSTAWRATVPRDGAPRDMQRDETGLWLGRGCHVVHYPVESGRTLNVVAVLVGPEPPGDAVEADQVSGSPALRPAGPALKELLAGPSAWTAWPLFDLDVGSMARGHIALLGDAAHPVLPYLAQGAALAIEDAATLAVCLGEGGDPRRALARYARLRRGRAARVQGHARRNGRAYHGGSLVAFGRDNVMRRLGERGMTERYAWLYGWRPPGSA